MVLSRSMHLRTRVTYVHVCFCACFVVLPIIKQVSVFDSSVQGGDAVWESLRVYNGKVFMLDRYRKALSSSGCWVDPWPGSDMLTLPVVTQVAWEFSRSEEVVETFNHSVSKLSLFINTAGGLSVYIDLGPNCDKNG